MENDTFWSRRTWQEKRKILLYYLESYFKLRDFNFSRLTLAVSVWLSGDTAA